MEGPSIEELISQESVDTLPYLQWEIDIVEEEVILISIFHQFNWHIFVPLQ